jgi:hypothetical protein
MFTLITSVARLFSLATLGLLLPVAAMAQAPTISSVLPATVAPGTTVTATGTRLANFTSVVLNG